MTDDHIPDRNVILARSAGGSLGDALFDEYGRIWLEDDSPTIALLADMHNAGEIDLLGILTTDVVERHSGHNFFQGQHVYEKLIPKISGSVREMVRVVETLRVGGGDDLAAGMHIDKFAKWCGDGASRPFDLLALIDEGVAEADGYLIIAIKTGVMIDRTLFIDRAYDFLENGTERQRLNALSALTQIEMPDEAEWDRLLAALSAARQANSSDPFRGQFLSSVVKRFKGAPPERAAALERMAAAAVAEGGDQTLHAAAGILAYGDTPISDDLERQLLDALRNVKGTNGGTLNMLDYGLSKLVKSGKADIVRTFVHDLIVRDEDAVRLGKLDSTVRAIVEDPGDALPDWVVAWLREGDPRLCSAMDRAMFDAGRDETALRVDFSSYGLRDAEYPYLARKVVASFFLKPLLMASLLASLLRSAPADAIAEVEEVLVDSVLKNYAGSTRKHLDPIAADEADPSAPAVRRALAAQDEYLEGLKSPGSVPELHPSERERQLEWERHTDSMTDAMRKARKKSIFAQIATESVLLYGRRAVSWVERPGEEPRRMESTLGSIGTSFEMPRIDIVDPVGLQIMLLAFRAEEPPK